MKKKHAYLIIAHNNPWQLSVLLELIDDKRNDIFLLIDSKSTLKEDQIHYTPVHSKFKVFRDEKMKVSWGGLSLILAEIFLLEQAVAEYEYTYFHLLSGLDLPIKSQDYIHDFFEKTTKEYVGFDDNHLYSALWKTERYHFFVDGFNYRGNRIYKYLRTSLVLLQKILGIKRKREFTKYYHGSALFSISLGFAKHLISRKAAIRKSYSYTLCCEEVFLQTELVNSSFERNPSTSEIPDRENMRLIDWSRRQGNSPYTWRSQDFEYMIDSPYLFARKIDEKVDKELIVKIRNSLLPIHNKI